MLGLPLTFAAPLVLAALVALPALWFLLRVTPPRPRRIDFPPLRILFDLVPREEQPAKTPWWLVLIRLAVAAAAILAMAGPIWNARDGAGLGAAPAVIVLDSGWAAAADWRARLTAAEERIALARRSGAGVALIATGERGTDASFLDAPGALERLRALRPVPFTPDRRLALPAIERVLQLSADAELLFVTDGVSADVAPADEEAFVARLRGLAAGRRVTVLRAPAAPALGLAGAENGPAALEARVLRAEANGRQTGGVRALDAKGLLLGEAPFAFEGNATETRARLALPGPLRNDIARLEIANELSAGSVFLLDERNRRRRVGLASGTPADQSQPLLAPTYYIARALNPFADVREPRGAAADVVPRLLDERVSVLVLADVGTLAPDLRARVARFVEEGGVLVRFAGARASAGNDDLLPVRLRRAGREFGGALSWDQPKGLAPFSRESPFSGLPVPNDVSVTRQLLAEPDANLSARTWASLTDGTPVVTAERRGKGLVALFHVTGDTTWSNLPLSGLFVGMLNRLVGLAAENAAGTGAATEADAAAGAVTRATLAPSRLLDGFGRFAPPTAEARPIAADATNRASAEHPAGFYGPADAARAVNVLDGTSALRPLDLAPLAARVEPIERGAPFDLRPWLVAAALLGLLVDTLATFLLAGGLGNLRRPRLASGAARGLALALAFGVGAALVAPGAFAQNGPPPAAAPRTDTAAPPLRADEARAALATRLAYVITGDAGIDEASRAGLLGLTSALATRTALEPGEPVGVDLARDEIAFYPLLYWPMAPSRQPPPQSAIRKLDGFMKNGGTVLFDTRDAITRRPNAPPTPEARMLRAILATLDVPELEPVPRDHVLTKTFYLIDNFPGRYADGPTWIEAIPPADGGERRPARAGDGVSPLIITANDLAAAWAVGRRGEPLYPLSSSNPRQREISYRAGINIVMYALTGNYKADQVHVPALLERLGQ